MMFITIDFGTYTTQTHRHTHTDTQTHTHSLEDLQAPTNVYGIELNN